MKKRESQPFLLVISTGHTSAYEIFKVLFQAAYTKPIGDDLLDTCLAIRINLESCHNLPKLTTFPKLS